VLGSLIDMARQFRRSEGFKNALNTPARIALHARQRLNGDYFVIEIRANSGFFSVMQIVLCTLLFCEDKHRTPVISARGGNYGDAQGKIDWLAECFENIAAPPVPPAGRVLRTSFVRDLGDLGFRRYERDLSVERASAVFLSHYRPTASIRAEVDDVCARLGIGASTLGVHYRGTDKHFEAHTIGFDELCRQVERTLEQAPHLTNLFVASDMAEFLDFFVNWGFAVPVSVAPATLLASGERPVHYSGYPGLAIGREALVTSLLLSRCGYLLKTPSYLSGWSKVFNPSLPVRLAVPPLDNASWFPDNRIWEAQQKPGGDPADAGTQAAQPDPPVSERGKAA